MSRASQLVIGGVSALMGFLVFVTALDSRPGQKPEPSVLFLLSAIAICISIACFFRRSRPVTMRLIGLVLLFAGIGGFFLEPSQDSTSRSQGRGYVFLVALAAGGGWLAVTGKYPSWGAYGNQLKTIEEANSRANIPVSMDATRHQAPGEKSGGISA